MRITCLLALCLVGGCFAETLTSPINERRSDRASVAESSKHICIDCNTMQVLPPYVMVVDGTRYRFPEDSARMRESFEHLLANDIEAVEVLKGPAASQLYATHACPAIVITTRRARK